MSKHCNSCACQTSWTPLQIGTNWLLVRMSADGFNPEAYSINGKDAVWAKSRDTLPAPLGDQTVKPLVCGAYHRTQWGSTGYESDKHWCRQAFSLLTGKPYVPPPVPQSTVQQPSVPPPSVPPPSVPPSAVSSRRFRRGRPFVVYYTSWSAPYALDQLPPRVDCVCLSFVHPQLPGWTGGVTLGGSGFDYKGGPEKLRRDVAGLRAKGVHVLASVGGGTAGDWWQAVDIPKIRRFVDAFQLSGVDIDYEPDTAWSANTTAGPRMLDLTRRFRLSFPEGEYMLTCAAWMSGVETGNMTPTLKSNLLDAVFIMSYDTDMDVVPYQKVLRDFRGHFSKILCLGVQTPPEGWGKHILTPSEVVQVAGIANAERDCGMMLWEIGKSNGTLKAPEVVALVTQHLT